VRAEIRAGLPGGRRALRIEAGAFEVVVMEVPGPSLTEAEWRSIRLARGSYAAMWGSAARHVLEDDPLDGRDGGPYESWHYLAWVRAGSGPAKLVVLRKVRLAPDPASAHEQTPLGDLMPWDVRSWRVQGDGGDVTTLWEELRAWMRRLVPAEACPELRVASIGRLGTSPIGRRPETAGQRDRTACAFAAIQLLATDGDPSLAYVITLCRELQDKVLAVRDVVGRSVQPAFTRTEEVLGLPAGSVVLDLRQVDVQAHKLAVPGYFVDHLDATELVGGLLDEGRLTLADLRPAIAAVIGGASSLGGAEALAGRLVMAVAAPPDHHAIAEILTHPRVFKYLVPLLAGAEPLERMSTADLRTRLIWETGNRPFSSTVLLPGWRASALRVLRALDERCGGGDVPGDQRMAGTHGGSR
jgi:hypothetical protein